MVYYFMSVPCAYSGSTRMMTHNGVKEMAKRRSKMMEKMNKERSQKMDKKRRNEAKTGWPASQPA